jgi:CD36 family
MLKFESPRKFKCAASVLCCCSVVLINMAIFIGLIMDSVIDRKITEQLVMTSSNEDTWGEVPGKYDVLVTRNLTLFHILNPECFETGTGPVQVSHTEPIYLREKHVTSNPSFSADGALVTFNQTVTFDLAMDRAKFDQICQSNVTVANMFAIGAWDSAAKQLNFTMKAFFTLGSVLATAVSDDEIFYEGVSMAVYLAYVSRNSLEQLYNKDFQPAGVSRELAEIVYWDGLHGWSNNNTIKKWCQAIVRGAESDDALFLADYFGLSFEQLGKLFKSRISKAVLEAVALVKDYYNCPPNPSGSLPCDPNYLIAIQVGRQQVSLFPPPPVAAVNPGGAIQLSRRQERDDFRLRRVLVLLQRVLPQTRLERLGVPGPRAHSRAVHAALRVRAGWLRGEQ